MRETIPRVAEGSDGEKFVIFEEEELPGNVGRPITAEYWSLEAKLAFMDRHGIDQTILSLGNPWLDPFDEEDGLAAARYLNEDFAKLANQTGGRILGMGALPPHSPNNVATLIGEIQSQGDIYGAITGTLIAGKTFDDPELNVVWAALEKTGVPLLVHPHRGAAMAELKGFGHAMPVAVGFPLETTIALARMVFAGVLHRFPGVRIVGSHGGGTIPFLTGRLDAGWRSDPSLANAMPTPPSEVLDRLFLDAVLYHPRALLAAADLVGVKHLMFGTDHPFSISDPATNIEAIRDAFGVEDAAWVLAGAALNLYSGAQL